MKLNLKNDVMFKAFFTKKGNEKYLKDFLEAILNIHIEKVEVLGEVSLEKLTLKEKLGKLDIKATINDNETINIEMQVENKKDIEKRTLFYGAKLVTEQIGRGDKYIQIKPVILINILDYEFIELPQYHTKTVIVADNHRECEIIKNISYHFIELPKFRKTVKDLENNLECWLALIDDKDGRLIEMAQTKKKIIKEAKGEIEQLSR